MKHDHNPELLFSYGMLRDESVQLSIFGRRLEGSTDSLIGYTVTTFEIADQEFAARNGATQRNAQFTGKESDVIDGVVFKITLDELQLADNYEPVDYKRVRAQLKSGAKAWVYVHAPPSPHGASEETYRKRRSR